MKPSKIRCRTRPRASAPAVLEATRPVNLGWQGGALLGAVVTVWLCGCGAFRGQAQECPITPLWVQMGPGPLIISPPNSTDGQGPDSGMVRDLVIDPSGTSDQVIYVATDSGGVWKTVDGGATWLPKTDYMPSLNIGAVALDPANPLIVYAGTGNAANQFASIGAGIYKSMDGGGTWAVLGANIFTNRAINRIVLPAPNLLLVASSAGVYRSVDGGQHFGNNLPNFDNAQPVALGNATDLDIDTASAATIYASIRGSGVLKSTDGGATFPPAGNLFTANNGSPSSPGFILFAQSTIPNNQTMYVQVQIIGTNNIVVMYKSVNGGNSWSQVNINTSDIEDSGEISYSGTIGVDPQDANRVFIGKRALYLAADGGASGITAANRIDLSKVHADQHALAFSPASHWAGPAPTRVYNGTDGGIATTANAGPGANWTLLNGSGTCSPTNGALATVLFRQIDIGRGNAANNRYTYGAAQDLGVSAHQPDCKGTPWLSGSGGDGNSIAVDPLNPQHALTADTSGSTLRSTSDGGKNWQSTGTGLPIPTTNNGISYTHVFYDPNGTFVYAADNKNNLFQSSDDGGNFTLMRTFSASITAMNITAIDSDTIWVGLADGTILRTASASQGALSTWASHTIPSGPVATAVSGIAVDPGDTQQAAVVFRSSSGSAYQTADNGNTWTKLSANLPDQPVNAVVIDPNTSPHATIVATDTGVMQTKDLGQTWTVVGAGLPNVHCTSLALDSSAVPSLLRVGTYGRSTFELAYGRVYATFSGNSSMGSNCYEILGGITTFQDDLSASGILLRGDGGKIQLLDSATADAATISVDGGMGNGGIPAFLEFKNNSTAAQASIENRPGVLGPNFKNEVPNPTAGLGGETRFFDSAMAGTAHIVNSAAAFGSSYDAAITSFEGNASADHAVIVNKGVSAVTSPYAYGGETEFTGSATAGAGTFTNLNSNNGSQYSQGRTVFFESANAGNGIFANIGGDGGFLPTGGTTEFRGSSSATNGTFMNFGGTGGSFPGRGATQFFDTATAANGAFTNKPGYASGGAVEFYGHSTAANGTFINDSPNGSIGGAPGEFLFRDDSVAGQAHFTSTGFYGGAVTFRDRSSADHGTFLITADVYDARYVFYGTSTADHGFFEIGGGGDIQFYESATAGNATIMIRGNETSGQASYGSFAGSATAGESAITVMGAENPGTVGGGLGFQGPATAGNATITVNGASVTTFGASGGSVSFDYGASAGNATLIVNGGSNGGAGGGLNFGRGGSGDQARVIVNAGGIVAAGSARIGSLAGAGNVVIWSGGLRTGGLNQDTEVSGVIANGYSPQDPLTKEGAGTLVLSGTNTYTGLTTVAAGTLAVNGSIRGDVLVKTGATLKGTGNIAGTVTAESGAIIAPGNSPGTLRIGGNYAQAPQGLLEIEVAGPNPSDYDHLIVNSNINLSGRLLLVFSGYAPSATDTFTVIQAGGTLSVSNLEIIVFGLKPGYRPNYQVNGGNLTLAATSSGQLRIIGDPIQALPPSFAPPSGFVYSVFTFAGLTYQFDTSTDLKTWTPVANYPGGNTVVEFRHFAPTAEPHRFFRLIEESGTP